MLQEWIASSQNQMYMNLQVHLVHKHNLESTKHIKNVVTGMDSLRTADAFPVVASLSQAKEWIAACQDQRFMTKTRRFLSVWTVGILTECIANLIE